MKSFPVPYKSHLEDKIEPGQTLIVQGETLQGVGSFTITFHAGKWSDEVDVPLQLTFDYLKSKVLMNTRQNGKWQEDGKEKSMKYKPGGTFDIRMRAHDDRFEILLDRKHFQEYHHLLPITQISHLSIEGPLKLHNVSWGGRYYTNPYEAGFTGGFGVGRKMLISGRPMGNRFHVNLTNEMGDIHFHMNPRFDEEKIVRNSLREGEWKNEEREGDEFPFDKHENFDIIIENEQHAFNVFVNGEKCLTFAHRMEPNKVKGIQVGGDVELWGIHILKFN